MLKSRAIIGCHQYQYENPIKETSSPFCPGVHLDRNFETVRPFFGQGPETSTNPCSEFYTGLGSLFFFQVL